MEHVLSADGTSIAYQQSGTGPPLILVHGIASDHSRWDVLVEQIRDRFTVYAMDRRGRGASGDRDEYSLEIEYEDIASLAHSIDGSVYLYGHSSGALYSLGAAPKIRNLRGLVLYEPVLANGTQITPDDVVTKIQNLLDEGDPEAALVTFMSAVVQMTPEEIDHYRTLPSWPSRVAAAPTFPREMRTTNEYRFEPSRFSGLRVPSLLLVGSDSPPLFTNSVETVHSTLPDSRVHVLQGQRHSADITAPEMVSDALVQFAREP